MTRLIATTTACASHSTGAGGSLFLVDLEMDRVLRPVHWSATGPESDGRGGNHGFRGVATRDDRVYVATSDELLELDLSFRMITAHRNRYLKDCQSLSVHGHHLFAASSAYDSILGFDLAAGEFNWALRIVSDGRVHAARRFDPAGDAGPLEIAKLELNSLQCLAGGMYVAGAATGALLRFGGRAIGVVATLPEGAHDGIPLRDGVLFNDSSSGTVRFENSTARLALPLPRLESELPPAGPGLPVAARTTGGRGLCALPDGRIAAGSTPASITVYDLELRQPVKVVSLSRDPRESIHTIAVWPHAWPARGLGES